MVMIEDIGDEIISKLDCSDFSRLPCKSRSPLKVILSQNSVVLR